MKLSTGDFFADTTRPTSYNGTWGVFRARSKLPKSQGRRPWWGRQGTSGVVGGSGELNERRCCRRPSPDQLPRRPRARCVKGGEETEKVGRMGEAPLGSHGLTHLRHHPAAMAASLFLLLSMCMAAGIFVASWTPPSAKWSTDVNFRQPTAKIQRPIRTSIKLSTRHAACRVL